MIELVPGLHLYPGHLDRAAQEHLRDAIARIVAMSPLFVPTMPRIGTPFSVRMTNCGPLGWVSDRVGGYRYQSTHPDTGQPWPAMPAMILDLWARLCDWPHPPEACLVNSYAPGTRMGLHQDRDEAATDAPILSVSLGDRCPFRYGGLARRDSTRSIKLSSGDVLVLGGPARMIFHGVDRIEPETSTLLPEAGRINLTVRRVSRPA